MLCLICSNLEAGSGLISVLWCKINSVYFTYTEIGLIKKSIFVIFNKSDAYIKKTIKEYSMKIK